MCGASSFADGMARGEPKIDDPYGSCVNGPCKDRPWNLQQVDEFREGVSEIFGMDMTPSFH